MKFLEMMFERSDYAAFPSACRALSQTSCREGAGSVGGARCGIPAPTEAPRRVPAAVRARGREGAAVPRQSQPRENPCGILHGSVLPATREGAEWGEVGGSAERTPTEVL